METLLEQNRTKVVDLLHELIGMHGLYKGHEYEFIEVLEQGPSIVLEYCGDAKVIQGDMHGEARRLVQQTYTVNLLSEVEPEIHPVLQEFLGDETCQLLNSALHGNG